MFPRTKWQGRPSHGGNEAEIFTIAILGENNFFAILGEEKVVNFSGKEIVVHERLGDLCRGKFTYLGKRKGENGNVMLNLESMTKKGTSDAGS